MSKRALGWATVVAFLAGCGGGGAAADTTTAGAGGAATSGGTGEPASNSSSVAPEGEGERRRGLAVHIQNVRAGGPLPEDSEQAFDRLDVSFELDLNHTTGTEPVTGISVSQARLVHDDGREIVFGVLGDGWDGRLDAGERRVVAFRKTPDSARPAPTRRFCGLPMRLEVTLNLVGRQARAFSRRIPIDCGGGETAGTR